MGHARGVRGPKSTVPSSANLVGSVAAGRSYRAFGAPVPNYSMQGGEWRVSRSPFLRSGRSSPHSFVPVPRPFVPVLRPFVPYSQIYHTADSSTDDGDWTDPYYTADSETEFEAENIDKVSDYYCMYLTIHSQTYLSL